MNLKKKQEIKSETAGGFYETMALRYEKNTLQINRRLRNHTIIDRNQKRKKKRIV